MDFIAHCKKVLEEGSDGVFTQIRVIHNIYLGFIYRLEEPDENYVSPPRELMFFGLVKPEDNRFKDLFNSLGCMIIDINGNIK